MASVTAAVPDGPIKYGCLLSLYDFDYPVPGIRTCSNETLGYKPTDFGSICCDGDIVDSTQDLWNNGKGPEEDAILSNLVCCRTLAPEQGGIQPIIQGNGKTCTAGTPTPLLDLAATNTENAQIYPVTFLNASGEPPNLGDFTFTQTPSCAYFLTDHGVTTTIITVPAATITTLPVGWPNSNDPLIFPTSVETFSQIPRMNVSIPSTRGTLATQLPQSTVSSLDSSSTMLTSPDSTVAEAASSPTTTSVGFKTRGEWLPSRYILIAFAILLLI